LPEESQGHWTDQVLARSSRRGFLEKLGVAVMGLAGARSVAQLALPDEADAYTNFCGHTFTTGNCPHPTGLPRVDGHGYPPALEDEGGLVILEDLKSDEAIGPRFEPDLVEPSPDEIEAALALGRVALSDVIDLADLLEIAGASNPEATRIVRHICVLDIWYSTRLGGPDPVLSPIADSIDAMVAAAGMFEDRIDEIRLTGETGIVVTDLEEWTLAKLLRRRTAHIREHTLELASRTPEE